MPSLSNLLGIWCEKEGIKNAKHGDRKMLFSLMSSITTQIWAHEPMLTVILGYMHWILQTIGSRKHMHRSTKKNIKICPVVFTLSSQPLALPLSSQDASLKTPRVGLQKGHDLGEVSIWSWMELLLLTTMPYFKLTFSRRACKDFKNLKFKDFMAYVFVLILLT